ncbi:BMP family ABC transporter substrate-binding protein [Hamadaea tsunoensis]|uniref:BMP family ABC transporter substrate-binding protein n=1 Tax=Hamadaea tsunoensis TaxID=53368 RepID=UPI00040835D9|nr:BMP family ABC transporter substrate-binding protein [Hamadaea tsunoensis]
MVKNGARLWLWLGGVALAVALVAASMVVWWPARPEKAAIPPSRTRDFAAFEACLLTGANGLAEPGVADVWAGMRDVSDATSIRISFLAASGPATTAGILPYLNALIQRGCGVIVAVGGPEVAAARAGAAKAPAMSFVLVGDGEARTNATVVPAGDGVRAGIGAAIRARVRS